MAANPKPTYEIGDFKHLVNTEFRDARDGSSPKVWVLGAGASIESGIPSASALCYQWSSDLLSAGQKPNPNQQDKTDLLKKWAEDSALKSFEKEIAVCLKEPGPNGRRLDDFLALRYFDVYKRRFGTNPKAGYKALREAMAGRVPSIGYLILAQMVSPPANLFVTVNFDNLIADALFLTGKNIPRILDHENVAHLMDMMDHVTLICKIHRDLLKGPQNTTDELKKLSDQWKGPINDIFTKCGPIFIGYGGNDHTLMDQLLAMPEKSIPTPIWLHYTSDIENHNAIREEVSEPIAKFLTKHKGVLIPHSGFDGLMYYAQEKLGLPEVLADYDSRTKQIRDGMEQKLKALAEATGQSSNTNPISKASVDLVRDKPGRSLEEWITIASAEQDLEERIDIYNQAIQLLEEKGEERLSWLFNNRGVAKAYLKRYEDAFADYDKAIELDPKDAQAFYNRGHGKVNLGNYENALTDFDKTIELDPKDAPAFYSRGVAKAHLKRYEDALADYGKTIELDPKYAPAFNNRGIAKAYLKRYEDALADYDQAIALDPKDASPYFNKACAYALQNEAKPALDWLEKAFQLDLKFVADAQTDSDFDLIRKTPEFKALLEKYKAKE